MKNSPQLELSPELKVLQSCRPVDSAGRKYLQTGKCHLTQLSFRDMACARTAAKRWAATWKIPTHTDADGYVMCKRSPKERFGIDNTVRVRAFSESNPDPNDDQHGRAFHMFSPYPLSHPSHETGVFWKPTQVTRLSSPMSRANSEIDCTN